MSRYNQYLTNLTRICGIGRLSFDARRRSLGFSFRDWSIHLWIEQTNMNQMPGRNALQLQKPRKKMGLLYSNL